MDTLKMEEDLFSNLTVFDEVVCPSKYNDRGIMTHWTCDQIDKYEKLEGAYHDIAFVCKGL